MRRQSALTVALLISLAVHLGSLVSPGWNGLDQSEPPGEAQRLVATLSAAAPAVAIAPAPQVKPKARPRPKPAVLPSDAPTAALPPEPSPAEAPLAEVSAPASTEALPEEPHLADLSGQAIPTANASAPLGDAFSQTPVAQRLPRQGRVRYVGSAGGFLTLPAYGQASWEHDGVHFQSRLTAGLTTPDSTLDYNSTGRLDGAQIISETTRNIRRGRLTTGLIDQAGGKVTMQRGSDTREREIKGLAVTISALPQLLVTLDERMEKVAFFIVGDFWVEDSVLIARGKETLDLPAGKVETRHYQSRTNNGSTVDIWLAPAWRNAPARVRVEQGNVSVDLKAAEVEIEGLLLAGAPELPRAE